MKWKYNTAYKHHTYTDYNVCVAYTKEHQEWFVATDIQKEIQLKYGKFVSLSKIGRTAKKLGLSKEVKSCGFKLYHKSLIDILGG